MTAPFSHRAAMKAKFLDLLVLSPQIMLSLNQAELRKIRLGREVVLDFPVLFYKKFGYCWRLLELVSWWLYHFCLKNVGRPCCVSWRM